MAGVERGKRILKLAGVAAAVAHALAVAWHSAAHVGLDIRLPLLWQNAYVALVIMALPVASAFVLRRRARAGFLLLSLSMLGSLLFGAYYHFVAAGPDNVGSLGRHAWASSFHTSAVLLAVTEAAGALAGLFGFYATAARDRAKPARAALKLFAAAGTLLTAVALALVLHLSANPRASFVAEVPTARATLVRNVRVYDPDAGRAGQPSSVLVEDGFISEVSGDPARPAPHGDCTVIDGGGAVLMPSLTDFHVHIGFSSGEPPWATSLLHPPDAAREKESYLYAGVTNVVEGSPSPFPNILPGQTDASPNVFETGRMVVARAGHPLPMIEALVQWPLSGYVAGRLTTEIDDIGTHGRLVREILEDPSAHHLKIVYDNSIPTGSPKLDADSLRGAIRLAHEYGKPAYVHAGSTSDALEAVRAGADVIMHVPFVDTFSDEQVRELAERGAAFVTTGQIWSWGSLGFDKSRELTPLERRLMPRATREAFEASWARVLDDFKPPHFDGVFIRERVPAYMRNAAANIKLLHGGGVTLLAGTDAGVPGLTPGASLQYELLYMASLGIPAADALRSATSAPARLLAREGRRFGSVAPGHAAELIMIEGDPAQDLSRLESVSYVFTRGKLYRRRL